jgi:hypothetical protein
MDEILIRQFKNKEG